MPIVTSRQNLQFRSVSVNLLLRQILLISFVHITHLTRLALESRLYRFWDGTIWIYSAGCLSQKVYAITCVIILQDRTQMFAFNTYHIFTLDDFLNKYSSLLHVCTKWFYISKCIYSLMTNLLRYLFKYFVKVNLHYQLVIWIINFYCFKHTWTCWNWI